MDDNSTRIINAAVGGQQVMDDNAIIWSAKTAIVNKKDALDTKITEVGELDDSVTDSSGLTTAKTTARNNAAKSAWKITKPMAVYAKDISDSVLEAEIDFEWTDLRYGKDQDVIDDWRLVRDRALTHETAMTTGGYIDAVWIAQLDTAITAFEDLRGKPKAKRSDIKAINAQIAIKIKEMQETKGDLLDLLVQFAESDPIFYNAVKAAFEKDMTGIRHIALRVRYVDEATGIRLPGVEGEIVESGLKKISSRRGVINFSFQELPQGNYTFGSKLNHYEDDSVQNVGVQDGEMLTLEIVLTKTGGAVGGYVKLAGVAVKDAIVSIAAAGIDTTTDLNGNYVLENVPAGTQTVEALLPPPSPPPSQTKQVAVVAGETGVVNFDF